MIISVSRRCDIPGFQFDWFMNKIREGVVEAVNPYNRNQVKRIPLIPARGLPAGLTERSFKDGVSAEEGVDAIVFWTRNPQKILNNIDELLERGFFFYVMVTLTGYPNTLEPSMTRTSKVINAMKELSKKIGAEKVIWRYDPVIFTNVTDENFHRRNFSDLAFKLSGSVRRVIISLYDEYREPKKRLDAAEKFSDLKMLDIGGNVYNLLAEFAKCAQAHGMEIQSCAEKEDFSSVGINRGACIDAALLENLFGVKLGGKDKNQRPNCLCCKSVDIGVYGTCPAGCVYCYAW